MKQVLWTAAWLTATLPLAAGADQLINENLIVHGNLCAGGACAVGEPFDANRDLILIKSSVPALRFEDVSNDADEEAADFQLAINNYIGTNMDAFFLEDLTFGTAPFAIKAGAQTNSLFINENGYVGLGTMFPQDDVHIAEFFNPSIRFEQLPSSTAFPYNWELGGNDAFFYLTDEMTDADPFRIYAGAPAQSLVVLGDGNVGLGTIAPAAPLELSGDDSFNFFRITATDAPVNESVDIVFTEGPVGTGQLRYNIVDGDNQEMSLDADGNMVLDGTLTTGGPTCGGGCDRVFDASFERLSVNEHAALMWQNGHLPAVGPTLPGEPVNVTEKIGAMLNELEHAHIYIARLHGQVQDQNARIADQDALNHALLARAAAQDALIADLAARLEAVETR